MLAPMDCVQHTATVAILADDLTSALDGAAPFATGGRHARVAFQADGGCNTPGTTWSLDMDSRLVSPDVAEARFSHAAQVCRQADILYKTMDSTLRGNIGREVNGAMQGSRRAHAIVAPAFPSAGRTTVHGRQLLNGIPIEMTEYGADRRTPVTSSAVSECLRPCSAGQFTVLDARTDADLDAVVNRIGVAADVLWVGSPGLGAALARAVRDCAPADHITTGSDTGRPAPATRVLVVIGSLNSANQPQVEALMRRGAAAVTFSGADASLGQLIRTLSSALRRSSVVCLSTTSREIATSTSRCATSMAAVVAQLEWEFDGLIVTGGDTARRVADALSAFGLDLYGETEPGVAVGALQTPTRLVPFAAKAGGFGVAATLVRCVDRLCGSRDSVNA